MWLRVKCKTSATLSSQNEIYTKARPFTIEAAISRVIGGLQRSNELIKAIIQPGIKTENPNKK